VPRDLRALLLIALRAQAGKGPHAEAARQVVLAILLAHILAGAQHEGPPHAHARPPRRQPKVRGRMARRGSVAGRRPRG
jgi:hypothetical protein